MTSSLYDETDVMRNVNDTPDPLVRLSNVPPFSGYEFSIDIGRAWEGAQSTLLQECSSITQRNQPNSCSELCRREGKTSSHDELTHCVLGKLSRHECCDTAYFYAGANAKHVVDDVFEGKADEFILDAELGEMAGLSGVVEELRKGESGSGKIVASPYMSSGDYVDDLYASSS